jgi:hypothetical protein
MEGRSTRQQLKSPSGRPPVNTSQKVELEIEIELETDFNLSYLN